MVWKNGKETKESSRFRNRKKLIWTRNKFLVFTGHQSTIIAK